MEQEPGSLDEIFDAPDATDEQSSNATAAQGTEATAPQGTAGADAGADPESKSQPLAADGTEKQPVSTAPLATDKQLPGGSDLRPSSADDVLSVQLARLGELKVTPAQLAAMGTTPEEFLAEVDRQSAALAGERAEIELREQLRPKAEELLAAVANGEMTQAVAERLFDAELKAAQAAQRISQAEAKAQALEAAQAAAMRDAQVARIAAEFPGVPEADLRELAADGVSLDKIRSLASKMSGLLSSREQEATAKYAARKESDKKSHVPARGDGAKESTIPARESFDDIWS